MKVLKYLFLTILVLSLSIVGAVYFLIDKDDISDFIKKETNKEVAFDDYKIKLFPQPAIFLKNVKFNEKDIIELSIEKAAVNIDFEKKTDLKSFKIKSILLYEPKIKIYEQKTSAKKGSEETKITLIDIDKFLIKNGSFSFNDQNIENFSADFSMTKEGQIHIKAFSIKELKGINQLNIKGKIDISKNNPYIDINILSGTSSIESIAENFNIEIPKAAHKDYLNSFSLDINIKGDQSKFYFQNSNITLDKTNIAFETVLENLDPSNMATVIQIDKIDLNKYIDFKEEKEETQDKKIQKSSEESYENYKKTVSLLKNIKNISSVKIKELTVKDKNIEDIYFKSKIKNLIIDINPLTFSIFGGDLKGIYNIDLQGEKPKFKVKQIIKNLEVSRLIEEKEKPLTGKVNLMTSLYFEGINEREILSSIKGVKLLKGDNLSFNLYDVDSILDSYEETQQISLLDIGAIAIAGPFAGVLTQGIKFGILYDKATSKGKTKIDKFLSFWVLNKGKAVTKDVALKTQRHLLALKGELDLMENEAKIELASVDKEGCPLFSQAINGNFKTKDIDAPINLVETFLGPVVSIFKKLEKCKPFYTGTLNKK